MKRTIKDLVEIRGKTILLRTDFNVPIDNNGRIMDATRIIQSIPTINYLIKQKAKVVIVSHLGRPKEYDIHQSLWPVAMFLKGKLRCNVSFCNSLMDEEAFARIKMLKEGNVLLLENARFFDGENSCDKNFSKKLASMADLYVNDAFGAAHRKSSSTFGVARILPNAIGLLMEKEIKALTPIVENPRRPFVAIIGGAKVSTKINVLKAIVEKADTLIIGGAMAYTFLKVQGKAVGESLVENDKLEDASEILDTARHLGKKILLPIDHVCLDKSKEHSKVIKTKELKGSLVGYDIGMETIKLFKQAIEGAGQIFWNGPMGKFEEPDFDFGTGQIGRAVAGSKAYTVVGGGDTVAAVNLFNLAGKINFVSTGGGATMEFIENGSLPCIDVIQEKII